MANGGQIKYGIGFNVDKSGLNEVKASLQEIKNMTLDEFKITFKGDNRQAIDDLLDAKRAAEQLDDALNKAFNKELGTLNISKFNQILKTSDKSLEELYKDLSKVGTKGQQAFRNMATELLTTNRQLKQTHNLLDKMAETMGNTIKWGVASSVMNSFTGSVQRAYGYVKNLDSSLNDIRIVTGKSAEEMDKFAVKANNAAKTLAASTTDYTDAALIYYQQGLAEGEVQARAEVTLKAANVTGQNAAEVSEQLTAVWNGYKVSAAETELYVDKLAAVAATTAADLEELSTGMSKVASAANAMGVDVDQLNGHLATVISVTRQAPELVGTAFKTIYARLGDLAVGGEDDFGVKLGEVSGKLKQMGIEILDQNGNMRDMGTVMEEVAAKWDGWTSSQREAAAVAMAGKRQYNNLIALFDNWDMYTEAVDTSTNAMGTLQNQQDIYMDSVEAHLQIMTTSFEDLYDSLLDENTIKDFADIMTSVANTATNFVDAIGGGGNTLLTFGSIATRVFSKNIAQSLAITISNLQAVKNNAKQVQAEFETLEMFKGIEVADIKQLVNMKKEVLNFNSIMTEGQHEQANNLIKLTNDLNNQQLAWEENVQQAEEYIEKISGIKDLNLNDGYDEGSDVGEAGEKVDKVIRSATRREKSIKEYQDSLFKLDKTLVSTKDSTKEFNNAQDQMKTLTDDAREEVERFSASNKLLKDQQEELIKGLKEYDKALADGEDPSIALKRLLSVYNKVNQDMRKTAEKTKDTLNKASRNVSEELQKNIQQAQDDFDNFINNLKLTQGIQQFINLTGAIGNVAAGIRDLSNISNIANDETLTAGEKSIQIIMALSSGLSMLYMGVTGMIGAGKALWVVLGGQVIAAEGAVVANAKYTASLFGITVSAGSAAAAVGLLALKLALIAAPILLVAGAIALAINNMDKEAKAAEKAAKNAENLAKSHRAAQEELKKLNEEIATLKDNNDALSKLEKGTAAWNEKLKESNNYILDLLEKYPQLAQYMYVDENGQMRLSNKGISELKAEKEREVDNAKVAEYTGAIVANDAQMVANDADIRKQIKYNTTKKRGNKKRIVQTTLSQTDYNAVVKTVAEKGEATTREDILKAVKNNTKAADAVMQYLPQIIGGLSENTNALGKTNDIYKKEIGKTILKNTGATGEKTKIAGLEGVLGEEHGIEYEKEKVEVKKLSDDQLIKQYGELTNQTFMKKDGSNYIFKDEAGKEESFTPDEVIDAIASNKAMDTVIKKWSDIADRLDSIIKSDKGQKTSGNLGQAVLSGGKDDAFDLENYLTDNDILNLAGAELDATKLGITDEIAKAKGYTGDNAASDYADDVITAIEEAAGKIQGPSSLEKTDESSQNDKDSKAASYAASLTKEQIEKIESGKITTAKELGLTKDEMAEEYGYATAEDLFEALKKGIDEEGKDFGSKWAKDGDYKDATYDETETDKILTKGGFTEEQFSNKKKGLSENMDADFATRASQNDTKKRTKKDIEDIIKARKKEKEGIEDLTEAEKKLIKENKDIVDAYNQETEEIEDVSTAYFEMNNGFQETLNHYEQWEAGLKKGKGTEEYADAMDGMRNSMAQILNVAPGVISDVLLTTENLTLMKKAAEGDTEALNQLRGIASEQYLVTIGLNDDALVQGKAFINQWADDINNLKPGVELNNEKFIKSLWQMKKETGMSIGQINELLSQMGMEPKITWKKVTFRPFKNAPEWLKGLAGDRGITIKLPWITAKKKDSTSIAEAPDTGDTGSTTVNPGGSGSTAKPKKEEKKDEKIDRYHDVDVKIEKTSRELDRLAEAQDKLTGKEAIENLNKQLKVLKQQAKVYKEKLDIARQEQRELEASLGRQGVQFQNGMIMNYAAAIKAEQNRHNAVIERYNNMSAAEQEKFQATLDESEKRFEKFMEDIERYDEVSHEVIEDLVDSLTDAAYQEIELNLEKLNIELEVKLDLTEAIKDWTDFEREVIQDLEDTDFLGYAKSYSKEMADLMGSGTAELLTGRLNDTVAALQQIDAGTYKEGEFGAYTEDGRWVVNKSAALEQLKSDQSELMAFLTDLHDKQEEINQSYLDNIDNISEAYEKQSELYGFIDDQLNHSLNVIKLLKGEEAYEDMAKFYEQQKINNDQLLAAQVQQQNYYREMMEKETDPEAAEKWKELWISATQEVNATVEKSLEDIMNDHMNNVKMALKEIDDALGGTRTIKAKWDVAVDQDSRWMDGVNKAYNLATLENKFNESINNVDSIKGQRELNKLKEQELAKLREKDKLTQYDVDRANQLLDIEMKRIALEEAQKNKSKMRLRRDASGNYSYQFVADEEAQAQAQQELMDAQNSLYNMDKEHLRETLDENLALWQEYQDLENEYHALSIEEQIQREEEFAIRKNNIKQNMTDIAAESELIQINLAQSTYDSLGLMYEEDGIRFSELNAEKQRQLTEELGPTFKNTMDTMIDAINNPENGYAAAWANADKTIADSNKAVETSLEGIEKRLGLTPEEGLRNVSSSYYTEAAKKAGELALAQQANIDKYKLEQDAIGEVKNKVDLLAKSWGAVGEAALAALQASQKYQVANGKKQDENKNQTNNQQNQKQENTSQKQETKNTGTGDGVAKVGDVVTFDNGSYYADSYGGGSSGSAQRGKQVKITYTNSGAPFPYHIATLSGGPLGWLKLSQLKGYDTGGYTGAWGEEGKLAMLHQKELVLNAHDTENMLAMVKMVRELMKGSSVSESQSDSPEAKLLGKIKLLTSLVQELRDSANIRTENLITLADITNKINKAEELSLAERYEHDKALLAIQQEQLFASWEQIQRFTAGVDAAVKEINTDSIAKFNQTAEALKAMTAKQDKYNDLLQDIKIYADFPDATNADEIKAAFNNLALTASQRAYSTKK